MRGGFRLYTCNSLEKLADCYLEGRRKSPLLFHASDAMVTEEVTVPTRGLSVWLEQYLVRHGTVLANHGFPYIQKTINRILAARYPDQMAQNEAEWLTGDVMAWRLWSMLQQGTLAERYPALAAYVREGHFPQTTDQFSPAASGEVSDENALSEIRSYQLAQQLAGIYDLYMANKPGWLHRLFPAIVRGDERGMESLLKEGTLENTNHLEQLRWQARLWDDLCHPDGADGRRLPTPADCLAEFLEEENPGGLEQLPPVTVFGVSMMMPAYLQFFKKLSQWVPVNFFYLNPSDEYWGDVKASWETRALEEPEELEDHFSNSLLGDLGMQGRKFFRQVLDLEGVTERRWEDVMPQKADADTDRENLLHEIQYQIRHCVNGREADEAPFVLKAADDSITVHQCHHDLRQVELLHDHLLHLLKTEKYSNTDILVMTPDIGRFAPLVHAVFDNGPLASEYVISDRALKQSNRLAECFLALLDVGKQRYRQPYIWGMLETDALREKFGLTIEQVREMQRRCSDMKIRWGRDGRHGALGFGDFENYSWQKGLDRMLLGTALEPEEDWDGAWEGLFPAEGSGSTTEAATLEGFLKFYRSLVRLEEMLQGKRSLAEWQRLFLQILPMFFQEDFSRQADYRILHDAICSLGQSVEFAGVGTMEATAKLVRQALGDISEKGVESPGFLNGRITFCSLEPMRGIPCRVVALLGMEEEAFPRRSVNHGLNLIAGEIEKEYRSRELSDRYLFLEALLATREHLLIYYNAQEASMKRSLPAAGPVTELLNYARRICGWPVGEKEFQPVVFHSLLSYNPQYFTAHKKNEITLLDRFSFQRENCETARYFQRQEDSPLDFADLTEQQWEGWMKVDLEADGLAGCPENLELPEVEAYFLNGSGTFFRRIGVCGAEGKLAASEDCEPFKTDSLGEYALRQQLHQWEVRRASDGDLEKEYLQALKLLDAVALEGNGDFLRPYVHAFKQEKTLVDLERGAVGLEFSCTLQGDVLHFPPLTAEKWEADRMQWGKWMQSARMKDGLMELEYYDSPVCLRGRVRVCRVGDRLAHVFFSGGSAFSKTFSSFYLRHLLICAGQPVDGGLSCCSFWYDAKGNVVKLPEIDRESAREKLARFLSIYLLGLRSALPCFRETCACELNVGRKAIGIGGKSPKGAYEGNAFQGIPGEKDRDGNASLWGDSYDDMKKSFGGLYCHIAEFCLDGAADLLKAYPAANEAKDVLR